MHKYKVQWNDKNGNLVSITFKSYFKALKQKMHRRSYSHNSRVRIIRKKKGNQ